MFVSAPERYSSAVKDFARAAYQRGDSPEEIVAALEAEFPDAKLPSASRVSNWANEEGWTADMKAVIEREERERVAAFLRSQNAKRRRPRRFELIGLGDAGWMQ